MQIGENEIPDSNNSTEMANINFAPALNGTHKNSFLSLYHGSFDSIGPQLAQITNHFEDFSIISNVPYGIQSNQYQNMNLQKTYRSFGNFLNYYPNLLKNGTFIVS